MRATKQSKLQSSSKSTEGVLKQCKPFMVFNE